MPASPRQGLVTTKAEELLTWDWQPVDDVLSKVSDFVPPGKALRLYESKRKKYLEKRGEPQGPTRRELTQDEKIYSGQKTLARDSLWTLVQSGRAEMEVVDGVKCVRFLERRNQHRDGICQGCGRPFAQAPKSPKLDPIPLNKRDNKVVINGVEKVRSWYEHQETLAQ